MLNKFAQGFSLLELIIVLVLISLLAVLGLNQYQHIILKTHRADAHTTLLDYHARIQRCFIHTHHYSACISEMNFPQESSSGFYRIEAINFDIKNYILQATAQHYQIEDVACYRFTINQIQQLMAYNQFSEENATCW